MTKTTSFADLKKGRQNNLEKLTQELQKMTTNSSSGNDDRFWQPTADKTGNGSATIRFLPAPANEDVPFVRVFDHAFKGPTGKWYIEKSLTTIGQTDPVSELNSKLWNKSDDDNSPERKQARTQKRRLHYISNIYVVKDPANPANEGKVFLYKYGKKIFDKLNDLMNPQFADETAVNPFDLWEGANFRLKIRQVEGYRNYDKSDFSDSSPLLDDDEELEAVWGKEYGLGEFIDPSKYKPYAELKKRLVEVLVLEDEYEAPARRAAPAQKKTIDETLDDDDIPPFEPTKKKSVPVITDDDDDDEDVMKYFQKLADED